MPIRRRSSPASPTTKKSNNITSGERFRSGKYYIVVRNISAHGGSSRVDILPREISKGVDGLHPPNAALINVYYVTDRTITGQRLKGTSYGTEPSDEDRVEYGVAKVRIPRAHAMGELEGPSILRLEFRENPEKHVVLVSATPERPDSFYKGVSGSGWPRAINTTRGSGFRPWVQRHIRSRGATDSTDFV